MNKEPLKIALSAEIILELVRGKTIMMDWHGKRIEIFPECSAYYIKAEEMKELNNKVFACQFNEYMDLLRKCREDSLSVSREDFEKCLKIMKEIELLKK
jgi:hypothetical protein